MADTNSAAMTREEFVQYLVDAGFDQSVVDADFDTIAGLFTSVLLDNYVSSLPVAEKEKLFEGVDQSTQEGVKEFADRINTHLQKNVNNYKPVAGLDSVAQQTKLIYDTKYKAGI